MVPRIRTIYFKQLLDMAFQRFLGDEDGSFTRLESEGKTTYVYSGTKSRTALKKKFLLLTVDETFSIFSEFSLENPTYNFVLGGCVPRKNPFLRLFSGENPLPEKLRNVIFSGSDVRYYVPEKDIRVDPIFFNSVFEDVFLELFDRKKARKHLGKLFRNVFFVRHTYLDCWMAYNVLRMAYGRNFVENVVKSSRMRTDVGLKSVNERIDVIVPGKMSFLKSEMMRPTRDEFLSFVGGCMEGRI